MDPFVDMPEEDGTHAEHPRSPALDIPQPAKRRGAKKPKLPEVPPLDRPAGDLRDDGVTWVDGESPKPAKESKKVPETTTATIPATAGMPEIKLTMKAPTAPQPPVSDLPFVPPPMAGAPRPLPPQGEGFKSTSILDTLGGSVEGQISVTRKRANLPRGVPKEDKKYYEGFIGRFDQTDTNVEKKLQDEVGGGDFEVSGMVLNPATNRAQEKRVTLSLAGDSKRLAEPTDEDGDPTVVGTGPFDHQGMNGHARPVQPFGFPGNGYPSGPFPPNGGPFPGQPFPGGPFGVPPWQGGWRPPYQPPAPPLDENKVEKIVASAIAQALAAAQPKGESAIESWVKLQGVNAQADAAARAETIKADVELKKLALEQAKLDLQRAESDRQRAHEIELKKWDVEKERLRIEGEKAKEEIAAREKRLTDLATQTQANAPQNQDPFKQGAAMLAFLQKWDEVKGGGSSAPEKSEYEQKADAVKGVLTGVGTAFGPLVERLAKAWESKQAPPQQQGHQLPPRQQQNQQVRVQQVRTPPAPPVVPPSLPTSAAPAPQPAPAPTVAPAPQPAPSPAPVTEAAKPEAPQQAPQNGEPEGLMKQLGYLRVMQWVVDKARKGNDPVTTSEYLKAWAAEQGLTNELQTLADTSLSDMEMNLSKVLLDYGFWLNTEAKRDLGDLQNLVKTQSGQVWVKTLMEKCRRAG